MSNCSLCRDASGALVYGSVRAHLIRNVTQPLSSTSRIREDLPPLRIVVFAPPNRCKKLTTRRLLARRPSGRLSQSALHGGAPPALPFSSRSTRRAAAFVAV